MGFHIWASKTKLCVLSYNYRPKYQMSSGPNVHYLLEIRTSQLDQMKQNPTVLFGLNSSFMKYNLMNFVLEFPKKVAILAKRRVDFRTS